MNKPAIDVRDNEVEIDCDRVSGRIVISKGGKPGGWTIKGACIDGAKQPMIEN